MNLSKLRRSFAIAGCIVGAIGMGFSLIGYICLFVMPATSPHQERMAFGFSICVVSCFPFLISVKWRTQSSEAKDFYGGGLLPAKGKLWASLRIALWCGFVTALIHFILAKNVPFPERETSFTLNGLMAAVTFYFGCFVLFFNLYGVHSVALYRFFWELFYGKPSNKQQRERR